MGGKLIRLFMAEGQPNGLRTVEISNMTILATFFPRTQLDKFSIRDVSQKPGVYLLLGNNLTEPDQLELYVGEGDPVLPRLKNHSVNKDFWTEAIVFSSKDDYLTKTQIKYLEAELYRLAKEGFQVKLDNSQVPTKPNISEVDKAEVDQFLDGIRLILLSLGIQIMEPGIIADSFQDTQKIFELKSKNAFGKMVIKDNDYVVLKGSTAVIDDRPSCPDAIKKMRQKLKDAGIITEDDNGLYVFNENAKFSSPSYAASVIIGGAINGRSHWKYGNKSIKQLEQESSPEGGELSDE
jgi:hypothetical protein